MKREPQFPEEELQLRILRILDARPDASQREVAEALGISLGRINFCIRALIDKGWVKARTFKNSRQKSAYLYLLTPTGVRQKGRLAYRFLQRKLKEFDELQIEIQRLRLEISRQKGL